MTTAGQMAATDAETASPRRLARQGVMLFAGFGAAQMFSFVRNAIIGHALSKGDFAIAAAITLVLQMIEVLTDVGADRLILQSPDGEKPRFLASAHALLIGRGILLSLFLLATAPLFARFFAMDDAVAAFQIAALTPFIKGFMHLDMRIAQRHFDNRPQLLVEAVPQALALALTFPVIAMTGNYTAVVALAILQAVATVVLSHALAKRRYRIAFDRAFLETQFAFGWPILVSALPLVAVYHLDRAVIAHVSGIEPFANYTAAFMITMVPSLIASKVGNALVLPLFADALRKDRTLTAKFMPAMELTAVFAALYLAAFIILGGTVLPLVFGAKYTGLGAVTAWLAATWALRMAETAPSMALMANGDTKPFVTTGLVRAAALPVIAIAASRDASIAQLAAIGFTFEIAAALYLAWRSNRVSDGIAMIFVQRCLYLAPAALMAALATAATPATTPALLTTATLTLLAVAASGIALMPTLNVLTRRALRRRRLIPSL